MLSGNISIEDDDWDSVRQSHAALTRDLERIFLSIGQGGNDFGGGSPKSANDQTVQQDGNYGFNAVTTDMLDELDAELRAAIAAAVAGISPDPPVGGDLSGVCSNASVIKLRGVSISVTGPSIDEQVLMYNLPLTKWEPVQLIASNGGVLSKDAGGLIEIAGGTALSVVGNATNTIGSINAIAAASADTILGRRGATLTWAKVAKAEMADGSAVSVIGRSANSTGVTADIAGAANQVMVCNATPALAFSRTITLGDTSNAGSVTIGNATSASAIVISPSLVTAAGKIMSVREIDVCDAGVAKKMLVLASATY